MHVIVTGGAGFIGSAVCRYLAGELGVSVLNIDKLTYAANLASVAEVASKPGYRFARVDICDRQAVSALFSDFRPHALIHLAAESHVDRSITGARAFVETNIVGTYSLLEATRDYLQTSGGAVAERFRFLHVSTDEVYGSIGREGLFSEATPYDPSSPYAASKAASDHLATAWHRTYGLPVVISNCSNNYGPYQFPEKLIPLMILAAREDRPMPVYGDGLHVRDWLHVEDHARALWLILTRGVPGEKYNIGGRNEQTNLAVVERICALMDAQCPEGRPHSRLITFVADRPGHDRRYAIDATRLERELGWRAQEDFASGLEKTVRWYLDNEAWWGPLQQTVYKGERLGLIAEGATTVPTTAS